MNEFDKNSKETAGQSIQPDAAITTKSTGTNGLVEWIIRLIKGVLVGVGAIVPGLSGGVLAVVFGIYEPLIRFLADVRVKFMENVRFFLPVGIGGVLGVVAFSAVVDYAFTHFAAPFTWLFIGFISEHSHPLQDFRGKEGANPGMGCSGGHGSRNFCTSWVG